MAVMSCEEFSHHAVYVARNHQTQVTCSTAPTFQFFRRKEGLLSHFTLGDIHEPMYRSLSLHVNSRAYQRIQHPAVLSIPARLNRYSMRKGCLLAHFSVVGISTHLAVVRVDWLRTSLCLTPDQRTSRQKSSQVALKACGNPGHR